jgi:uncharacterized RDD family membrane protein YckC
MPYCQNCGNELSPEDRYCQRCGAPVISEPKVAPLHAVPIASDLKLAHWGERFVAWLIDVIILGVFLALLELLTQFAWQPFYFSPSWFPLFNFGSGGVFYFLYWMLMDGTYSQSIGKMVMGLRIVRLDGRRISMGQAALESVGKAFFLIIDFLIGWALYPKRHQRIFNYLSETVVVRERRD